MPITIASLAGDQTQRHPPSRELWLDVGGSTVHLRSNSAVLVDDLSRYFADLVVPSRAGANIRITAIETEPPRFPVD